MEYYLKQLSITEFDRIITVGQIISETFLAMAAIIPKGRAIMEATKKFFLTILSFEKYIGW